MDSRVSMESVFQNSIADNERITDQLSTLQTQAATGQQFANVSDDPSAALQVLSATDQDQLLTSHLNNIQSATTALNTSVSALQQVSNIFTNAKSIAIQASNSTNSPSSLETMAEQVDALINNLVGVANTQNNNTYVFGGTDTQTPPFAVTQQNAQGGAQTVSYQGSDQSAAAVVNTNQDVDLYYPGNEVFQNAFQSLIALRDDLNNVNNLSPTDQINATSSSIAGLDDVNNQVLTTLGQQSASLQSLTSLQTNLQNMQLNTKQTISNVGNADVANVVVQLQSYEQLLQLSLMSFEQITSISLLNYMR
jgi:flagellar hook-associated protein 3 FlgL